MFLLISYFLFFNQFNFNFISHIFKAEDVVNSTTKFIPAVMFNRRKDVSSITYAIYTDMIL